jgi:LPS-assembly lipoprotein
MRAALGLLLAAPALSACGNGGFRPMYASTAFGGTEVDQKMAQVDVGTVPGRVGQRLRNELIYQTTGGGERQQPVYKLEIATRENVVSTLVRSDGEAASQIYNLDAAFRLTDMRSKAIVLEGVSYGRAGFERFTSIFSNVRAREEAENRAAKTVAIDIKTRLSAYLATAT